MNYNKSSENTSFHDVIKTCLIAVNVGVKKVKYRFLRLCCRVTLHFTYKIITFISFYKEFSLKQLIF